MLLTPLSQSGGGPSGLVLALTLAKNGVPVRIIDKEAKYHLGQRGSGIQPRTLELYNLLGVMPDLLKGGKFLIPRCVYEMPGGRKPEKIYDMSPFQEPTPSVPFVRCPVVHQKRSLIEFYRGTRGSSDRATTKRSYVHTLPSTVSTWS